jgi:polyphosphate kinase 2 (PPK2 family)
MFETANLDPRIGKAAYRREEAELREQLLNAQYDLKKDGSFAVLVLMAGVQGAGRGETVNLLNEWMGVFFGAWHTGPIMRRVQRDTSDSEFAHEISQVSRLEKMLFDEGVLLLKYWFHVTKEKQRARLKQALAHHPGHACALPRARVWPPYAQRAR